MRLKFAFLLLLVLPAPAQSNKSSLKQRLLKQPLYLRGMWVSDELQFDPAGHLVGSSEKAPFTLSGVEITKLDFKSDRLLLSGHRVGLELDGPEPRRVDLIIGVPKKPQEERISIALARPTSGDYTQALDAIVTPDLAALAPDLPAAWQDWATVHLLHETLSPIPQFVGRDRLYRIGGDVKEPFVAKTVEPEYKSSPYASALRLQGKVVVRFIVGTDGKVSHAVIDQALGLGLDESAITAVNSYYFGPATLHNHAVAVALAVEVNFQIF